MPCVLDVLGNCNIRDPLNEYWIGLEQNPPKQQVALLHVRRGAWVWVDGSEYQWMNWDNSTGNEEPTGGSGRARLLYEGTWSDKEEEAMLRYICERGRFKMSAKAYMYYLF